MVGSALIRQGGQRSSRAAAYLKARCFFAGKYCSRLERVRHAGDGGDQKHVSSRQD